MLNQENQDINHNIDHSDKRIRVIDNFLPEEYFDSIRRMSEELPWCFNKSSVAQDNRPQFTHAFYKDFEPVSEYWKYIKGILSVLRPEMGLFRVKANLTQREDKLYQKPFHVDINSKFTGLPIKHRVCILYLNTNDGYTIFESSGEKVMSIANRAVLFPGHLRHAGTNCTDESSRIVLNIDYF